MDPHFETVGHLEVGISLPMYSAMRRSPCRVAAFGSGIADKINPLFFHLAARTMIQSESQEPPHRDWATLERELAQYREDSLRLQVVLRSRSWRWTRPIRVLARIIRHGGWVDSDRERLTGAIRRLVHRVPWIGKRKASAPMPAPIASSRSVEDLLAPSQLERLNVRPSAQTDKPDIYVWSVIDWHFRVQRPQHLARALAGAGHRVFYISNNFIDRDAPGFALEPLDEQGRLFQVNLHLAGAPAIYHASPAPGQLAQLATGLSEFAAWHAGSHAVSIIQHPYWTWLAGRLPAMEIVYDCMDHHAGFADNSEGILAEERQLMATADLVIVTSDWLRKDIEAKGHPVELVRNGTDFLHFSRAPRGVFVDDQRRNVIGYYGAIAHWFDVDLVRAVAERFPTCLVLLIGDDTCGAGFRLSDLDNVRMVGEVKYAELPYWLYGIDVCLLPFRVEPLTLATNPVKVYEYLSAGKPVVVVDLPEMAQFKGLVEVAGSRQAFLDAVGAALAGDEAETLPARRREFASGQSWAHRALELDAALDRSSVPAVSVIVVTYNNLDYTRACLQSLDEFSEWARLEVIVVDNASQDGTPQFLQQWASAATGRKAVLNQDNRGFAAANNQGLACAGGDYLILLNNDTYVTRGWIRGLLMHLQRNPDVGLVGPVTNNIGNEARIETGYEGMEDMAKFAAAHGAMHAGQSFPIPTLAFFCVAMPRSTYERVGQLDEAFGVGFFEDDDYCRRIEAEGMHCICAEDVFVHHHLSASFDKMKSDAKRELFERNKQTYESKWGAWTPHVYRPPGNKK